MPGLADLRMSEGGAEIYYVDDVRTVPPTRLGIVGRVYPDGFDRTPRWNSAGSGARFRHHETPYSTAEGALKTFVGPDA